MPLSNPRVGKPTGGYSLMSMSELFNQILQDFAEHFKLCEKKRVVLPLDQAGWHTTERLQVPNGIHLLHLPAYSPELQPAQRLWPLVNEPLVNQAFDSIEEVEEVDRR